MLALIKNNIRLLLARKGILFLLLVLPILLMAGGLAIDASGRDTLYLGVADEDQSVLSKSLMDEMASLGTESKAFVQDELESALIEQKVEAVLLIPQGFEAEILSGKSPKLTLKSLKGQEIVAMPRAQLDLYLGALETFVAINQPVSGQALVESYKKMNDEGIDFHVEEVQRSNQGLAIGGGFLLYILSLNMLQVGALLLREKAWHTQDRIQRSPVTRLSYLGANVATGLFFLLTNLLSIFILANVIFRIRTTPEMYLIWLVYGLVWVGIGIWIAMIVPSTQVHSNVSPIVTTIGAMLGGSFWPLSLMPDFMKKLAAITPHYWANQWLESVQKGNGLLRQPQYLIALAGFICLFLALSIFSLSRKKKAQSFI